MTRHREAAPLAVWSALGIVYVVWGSTYLAIAITVQTLPPLLAAGLRFSVAAILLLAWTIARHGVAAARPGRAELRAAAIVGLLLFVGGNGMLQVAERTVPSGLAALIVASLPLWIVVFRRVVGERIELSTAVGVAIGFAGVAFLVFPRGTGAALDELGLGLTVAATISWSLGTFVSTRLQLPRDTVMSTGYQQLIGGAGLIAVGLASGEAARFDPATFSLRSIVALAYLIVFGSLIAFTAFGWVLQHAPVSKVATYAYVNPVIAVVLGAVINAEAITPSILVGAAIIVAAVAFIVSREGARQRAGRERAAPAGGEAN